MEERRIFVAVAPFLIGERIHRKVEKGAQFHFVPVELRFRRERPVWRWLVCGCFRICGEGGEGSTAQETASRILTQEGHGRILSNSGPKNDDTLPVHGTFERPGYLAILLDGGGWTALVSCPVNAIQNDPGIDLIYLCSRIAENSQ
jgi:hypothetical protein